MTAKEEVAKIRAAIKRAGFAVMQTSGDWSIHDVSAKAKIDEERETRLISEHLDMLLMLKALVPEQYGCLKKHTFITDPDCADCMRYEGARRLIVSCSRPF